MASHIFLYFILRMLRIISMEEWFFEDFMQLMIAWLNSQMDSCGNTWQTNAAGRGFFTYYKLVWDPNGMSGFEISLIVIST